MDAVEDIKQRLSIEDVISEYVQLKRAGRNFKGLSPFNNEKTPSFMVSPEKQIWHDFSSGKGGDVFSFVMEMEGLDFKGALELLARKAGVDLSRYRGGRPGDNGKFKERLYQALDQAAKFYQVQFSKNQTALNYIFKQRAFAKDVALSFRIGYAPNTGDALLSYLKKQGFSEEEMSKAGLVTRRYRGVGDMFKGRVMVPLMDAQGRVIGFTARLLADDPEAPKYINTPQTPLYDKSRHVFGLHLAKEAIRQAKFAVVVEGNLDVIASHQAGVRQVVATAGTAVTEAHLKTLGRFTPDIRIAFDQDQAGLAAAERAIPLASKAGVSLSIITIPAGKDPDELVKKDPRLWEAAIHKNQYALDWLIERHKEQEDLSTAEGKRRFSDTLLTVIRQLTDSVEQDHYLQTLAEVAGVSAEAMRGKLNQRKSVKRPLKQRKVQPDEVKKAEVELQKIQDHLLALGLFRPRQRTYLEAITAEMLPGGEAKRLHAFLLKNPDYNAAASGAELQALSDYVKILGLQYETLYQDLDDLEAGYEAARLKHRLVEHYVKSKKALITDELHSADQKRTQQLLEQARALDALLRTGSSG